MTQVLTERYQARMVGTLSCYDRIVITGTLPGICYAQGMTSFLYSRGRDNGTSGSGIDSDREI